MGSGEEIIQRLRDVVDGLDVLDLVRKVVVTVTPVKVTNAFIYGDLKEFVSQLYPLFTVFFFAFYVENIMENIVAKVVRCNTGLIINPFVIWVDLELRIY